MCVTRTVVRQRMVDASEGKYNTYYTSSTSDGYRTITELDTILRPRKSRNEAISCLSHLYYLVWYCLSLLRPAIFGQRYSLVLRKYYKAERVGDGARSMKKAASKTPIDRKINGRDRANGATKRANVAVMLPTIPSGSTLAPKQWARKGRDCWLCCALGTKSTTIIFLRPIKFQQISKLHTAATQSTVLLTTIIVLREH